MRQLPQSFCTRTSARRKQIGVPAVCVASLTMLCLNAPSTLGFTLPKAAAATPPIAQQAADAGTRLMDAANAVATAQKAVEAANDKMPEVERKSAVAQAASEAAKQNEAAAVSSVKQAEAAVATQQVALGQSAAQVDLTLGKVAHLARQSYITGGQIPSEIELILESKDPSTFTTQLQAVRRSARGNNTALTELAAARNIQKAQLAKLTAIQATVTQRQATATQQAEVAAAANQQAATAEAEVKDLVQQRTVQLRSVQTQRSQVAALYQQLLAQQRAELLAAERAQRAAEAAARKKAAAQAAAKAAAEAAKQKQNPTSGGTNTPAPSQVPIPPPVITGTGGYVSTFGTGRSAKAAIQWALSYVGNGRDYHNMCLRFVDDAYAVSHGRIGTAIAQWYRALNAGYGHPGDRNPPIGAQVYWSTSNPARHIALYAGGGMVISTDAASGAVGFVPLRELDAWGPYLGWAAPYYP